MYAFVYALHIGIIGGFVTRAFAFMTALLLIALTGTGLTKTRSRIEHIIDARNTSRCELHRIAPPH
jgi:hypothetical protein